MKTLTLLMFMTFFGGVYAQEFTQTIRGTLIDTDSKIPVFGAKVMVVGTSPTKGAITDENGDFSIKEVRVGRVHLKITAVGYREINLPSVLIESGKEKIVNLELLEDIQEVTNVEVKATKDKSESINKMATVSAKTFTVEETNRYAGSLNDPARMVSGFAGVNGDAEGDNDIVVRGNSPRGILWRLDGIDIPNPNHFAGEGSTGGPVNALNGSMLANSDFFSGAFAPEYGNALSGVFDVRFRQGNNEKREYTFSAGVLGIDGTLEGPFKEGYRGSYLVNYRYSSIALLDKLGILDFDGIPIYQDASFKVDLPTKKAGRFSLIGLGGISHILQTDENDETGQVYARYDFGSRMGVVGLKHLYVVNPQVYVKSYVSASTFGNYVDVEELKSDSSALYDSFSDSFDDHKIKAQSIVNYKPNQKNIFQAGATYTHSIYQFYELEDENESGVLSRIMDASGSAGMIQSFVSWKYRASNDLTIVSGVHHTSFLLNNSSAIEPRLGMKWKPTPRQSFSLGFGMHSKAESISTYLYNQLQPDGTYLAPNRNLELSKSAHFVAGYGFQLSEHLYAKTEVYYQHLYNIPVHNDPTGTFSIINTASGIPTIEMVNEGTGRNYGVELTVERFFSNNFYYLITGSLYKSKYTAMDGVERDSRYDANYATNVLMGKEFKFGKKGNKTFGINTKVSMLGGNRYTPIDLEASQAAGYTVRQWDKPYSAKGENIFFLNLGMTYRVDMKKTSHSIKIDIQNLTNHQAAVSEYYDGRTGQVEQDTQLSLVPNLMYVVKF
ncbi:MAG: TonB-dependent receptor [Crocinitomicaceae bacterium]